MSTTPQPEPVIEQRAAAPPGNIPKGRQTYIMIGIAVVIVLAIVFSGSTTTPNAKPGANLPPLHVASPSKREIDGYAQALLQAEQQAKKAQGEAQRSQALLQQLNGQAALPSTNTGIQGGIPGQAVVGSDGKVYYAQNPPMPALPVPQQSIASQKKEEQEANSLFASPVALSLRPTAKASAVSTATVSDPVPAAPTAPASLPVATPLERAKYEVPQHVLWEDTILEAVLTNRLSGSFSGPVNAMVTTNVYSPDRHLLLIPQGSRVLGEARRVTEQQQQRLAISFHRLLMQDGYSVNLDQFPGLDQVGATGMKDQVNHHYLSVFGTSIALGVLAGFSQFGTGSTLTANGTDVYRQGVASQLSQNSTTLLSRELNRLPDVTIREGQRLRIMLTKDLSLPAYEAHPRKGE